MKNVRSSGSGTLEYVYDAAPVETVSMSSENLSAVLAGMHDLAADGAVSSYFKDCIVDAAAKTGTIQTGDAKNNNGAFVCFAPYDDPQIAVAIVIEKGGTGRGAGLHRRAGAQRLLLQHVRVLRDHGRKRTLGLSAPKWRALL